MLLVSLSFYVNFYNLVPNFSQENVILRFTSWTESNFFIGFAKQHVSYLGFYILDRRSLITRNPFASRQENLFHLNKKTYSIKTENLLHFDKKTYYKTRKYFAFVGKRKLPLGGLRTNPQTVGAASSLNFIRRILCKQPFLLNFF